MKISHLITPHCLVVIAVFSWLVQMFFWEANFDKTRELWALLCEDRSFSYSIFILLLIFDCLLCTYRAPTFSRFFYFNFKKLCVVTFLISRFIWICNCLCICKGGLHESETLGVPPLSLSARVLEIQLTELSAVVCVTF